jgi:hypothetical protein
MEGFDHNFTKEKDGFCDFLPRRLSHPLFIFIYRNHVLWESVCKKRYKLYGIGRRYTVIKWGTVLAGCEE